MKKFLAILLAMMLVMVSVAAMATSGDTGNTDTGNTETGNTETGNTETGNTEGGSTEGGNTEGGEGGTQNTGTTAGTVQLDVNPAEVSIDVGDVETPTEDQVVTITKNFTVNTFDATKDKIPARKIEFTVDMDNATVEKATTVTTAPEVTIDDLELAEGVEEGPVNINLPAFSEVGVYIYPIIEEDTGIAGLTGATSMELRVTVVRNTDPKSENFGNLEIGGIAIRENGTKTDELENQYDSGSLYIKKTVSGNMGDRAADWLFTVVFTAPADTKVYSEINITGDGIVKAINNATANAITSIATETSGWSSKTVYVTLKHGQNVAFTNLPAGVTYTVTETENKNYTKTEDFSNPAKEITSKVQDKAVFDNEWDETPDTGITLETLPYVLMMALAMMGLVALKLRKREEY